MEEIDFNPDQQKILRVIFDKIKKEARVSEDERKEKRRIVENVLNNLMFEMKCHDKLFSEMFVELTYTGSYFDNLRIVDANEFDINVVLELPVRRDKIMLVSNVNTPSFTELRLDYSSGDPTKSLLPEVKARFLKLMDGNNRIVPEKVLSWMQGVLAKASESSRIAGRITSLQGHVVFKLLWSSSGPAKTVKIQVDHQSSTIDVDLVAVFRLHQARWSENATCFRNDIVKKFSNAPSVYLVPKRYQHVPAYMWRKHFPEVEKELLCGKVAVKPVIRILKLLRDSCQWSQISSYYLKTLVMIEVYNHLNEAQYWTDKRTPFLVFTMMANLQDYMSRRSLPHLLYKDVNLFNGISPDALFNYGHRLKRILNICRTDFELIENFFILGDRVQEVQEEAPSWNCVIL